ncbi:MAG: DUF4097 family beta strand repeat-containing protein [Phycisphaerales bacterium]
MNGRARRWAAIGLGAVGLATMPACIMVIGFDGACVYEGYDYVEVQRTGTITPAEDARVVLDVETSNGSISVERFEGKSVEVVADFKTLDEERADGVGLDLGHDAKTGVLRVRAVWPGGEPRQARGGSESVSFKIRVPRTDGVRLESKNGSLTTKGLGGESTLHTSNGKITVNGHAGSVSAVTSNGKIEMHAVGGEVDANSSNGEISLEGVEGAAKAVTSNGRVEVELASTSTGPVELRTSNGSVDLTVGSAFAGSIDYGLSLGSVTLRGFPDNTVTKNAKNSGVIRLGDGPESVVRTSLGSITIEREG